MRAVLLLVFAAVLIALILEGFARLQGRVFPAPRGVRLAIAALVLVAAGLWVVWMFGNELQAQIAQLLDLIPGGWRDLQAWVGEDRLNAITDKISPSGSNILGVLQSIANMVTSALSGLFLALIGGIFIATRPRTYRRGLLLLLPQSWEARGEDVLDALGATLRAWLKGQIVSMLFQGTTIFIGLWLIGAPSPLALAVIAAVLTFVPVIGPLLAAIPAVLIGLTLGMPALGWIVLLYFVVQNFDGNVLNPLVMRQIVKIPPAVMLFSLFAVGALFGPVGVLLGGPIAVTVFTLVRHLWVAGALNRPLPD